MTAGTYRCHVCKATFPRTSRRGRKPKYCPEHRAQGYYQTDQATRKTGGADRSECCTQLGPRRVCRQHKQWRSLQRSMHRKPRCGCTDCMLTRERLEAFWSFESGADGDGGSIREVYDNPGFYITATP